MAICKNGHRISLLIEGYPRVGLQTFTKLLRSGARGICISRLHPDYVTQKFGLGANKCYWLSGCKGKEVLSPRMLGHIVRAVKSSIRENKQNVVFFDGLEYLLLYNDMSKVMTFLEEMDVLLGKLDGEMVVCIDPLTFEQKDLERLWAAYPKCTPEEMMLTLSNQPLQQSGEGAPASASQTI